MNLQNTSRVVVSWQTLAALQILFDTKLQHCPALDVEQNAVVVDCVEDVVCPSTECAVSASVIMKILKAPVFAGSTLHTQHKSVREMRSSSN